MNLHSELNQNPAEKEPSESKETKGKNAHKVPKELLDQFWHLATPDDEKRITAAVKIIQLLKPEISFEDPSDNLKYTIKRLVAGLSSSRQSAPHGYAMAFCELLRHYGSILSLDYLLQTIEENLAITKQDTKSHQTHIHLGKILALTAIVRSGKIKEASKKQLQRVLGCLMKIRSKHPSLGATTTELISLLCTQTKRTLLAEVLMDNVQDELTTGWQTCNADTLHLLMTLQLHKFVTEDFMSENWESDKMITARHYPHIARVMVQSVAYHPIVHGVNHMIISQALDLGPKAFNKFWSTVVMDEVFSTEKPTRCYMVYQLIPTVLKSSKMKSQSVVTVLSPDLIGAVMKHIVHKESYLHKAAIKLMASIIEIVKGSDDSSFQLAVLKCFLSEPSSFMFDSLTSTKTVANIVTYLNKEATVELSNELMKVIATKQPLYGKTGESVVSWCSMTLVHMLTNPSIATSSEFQWQTSVVKFLMLHSSFSVMKPLASTEHCGEAVDIETTDRQHIKEALLKGLDNLSTFSQVKKSVDGVVNSFDYNELLYQLTEYTDKLFSASDNHVQPLKSLSDEESSMWKTAIVECKSIGSKTERSKQSKENEEIFKGFQLMLELFALHIFLSDSAETSEVCDTLKEILTCLKKASSKSKTRGKSDDPEWSDVLTEVLISLMAKSSHLFRSVSTSVFTKLLPICSLSSLQLVLDVFESGENEFEEEDDGEDVEEDMNMMNGKDEEQSDSDKDEEDDEDQEKKQKNEDGDTGDDSDESDDDDDDEDSGLEEDAGEVDENLRNAIKAALGDAAAPDDEEGEDAEDEDLPDSEMFKLDDALAAAFRSMRKARKNSPEELEKRKQIKHFKLRCLDLVDVVVKHSDKGELLMELVLPLISLIELGYKEKEQKELGKKASTVFQHLVGLKKLPPTTVADRSEVTEKVTELLKMSTNSYVWPIMKEITSAVSLMIKLLSTAEESKKPTSRKKKLEKGTPLLALVTGPVENALAEFVSKRETRYSHTLFYGIFERHPTLFWNCTEILLKTICNSDVRIFCRTQACSLLLLLLNKSTVADTNASEWVRFKQSLPEVIDKVVSFSSTFMKAGFLLEFFNLLHRCKAVDKQLILNVEGFSEPSSKFNKELMRSYRRLTNRPRSNSSTSKAVVAINTSSSGRTNGNTEPVQKLQGKRKNSKSAAEETEELSSPIKSLRV